MKLRNPNYFLALIALIATTVFASCNSKAQQSGGDIPDYKDLSKNEAVEKAVFKGLDGNLVSVGDFKGKVIMLDFWETWCKPCVNSFPTIDKLVRDYPDDFAVIAVTPGFMNGKADAQEFADNHDYQFHFAMDTGLAQKLSIQSIPYKVFVDAEGNYLSTKIGSYGPEKDYKDIKEIIEKHSK
jgi:thiol-disulfide isomerase/thioredoxin